jgi:site-specific DNA recombinase
LRPQHRYYCCRGKLSDLNSNRETKCRSRFIPAEPMESLVWEDLCRLLTHPEAISYALERAHGGHWLPQDLQARRDALKRGQVRVEQQIERLTEAYLSEVVGLEEYRRRRHDLEQKAQSLGAQRQQLEAQVDRQSEIARVSLSIDEFCRRVQKGLEQATWEQKRQLIEWLVVRVIVTDGDVEIRYAIPTSPNGEATRFCHLQSDYRELLLRLEAVPPHRHALRQDRSEL